MSAVVNRIRSGFFMDSVALMRLSRRIAALDGVEEAALMMGTPANREIMTDAGLLANGGEAAGGGDLVLAVRAGDAATATAALDQAEADLERPAATGGGSQARRPRTLRAATEALAGANLALISVPGDFAAAEARKALESGLNVMIFSDNVALEDEIALKQQGRARGLLVMGPDCGTAIIGGVPLAFANAVPRGDIGIIGASGTGTQEVSCLIAQAGGGVSHAIGVGGRDLKSKVGGITTLMALDALDADAATRHIVLVSKPPADDVAARIAERIAASKKTFTVCFMGAGETSLPANAQLTTTLREAARHALGEPGEEPTPEPKAVANGRRGVRGLFCGGTLAAEAQIMFMAAQQSVASNAPVPGARALADADGAHQLIDLGEDQYTRGRPHPMIDPVVRDEVLAQALAEPGLGIVLLDVVIGYGADADPAGHVAQTLAGQGSDRPLVIASVTGTDGDPQNRAAQMAVLADAGILVAPSNAAAAELALACLRLSG